MKCTLLYASRFNKSKKSNTTNVSRDACPTTPMHKSWLDTLDADIGQLALRLFVFEMNPNSIRYGTVLLSRPHPIGQTWPIQGRTANPHHFYMTYKL
ncbi:hypothetical protein T12_1627 [Trichinella patagoniensis]|uniref:Uncharacterized protein n=1 Tax=Trichinella patagoniensis TaxID=990121 RepID=A0A0V0ZNZ1_9BILA|nr:hypothetical protein T12_1627 [Trichinella patagoniensis]